MNFAKFLRTSFLQNTFGRMLLKVAKKGFYSVKIVNTLMLSQNGQTHLNNLVANAARFSKWVKPFREIAHEDLPSVKTGNKSDGAIVPVIMKTL